MIATVLGGSAGSTPWLVRWLADKKPNKSMTLRLAGRTPDRLEAVARASRILAAGTRVEIESFERSRWDQAIQGADVVIIQARIGGLQGREFDESFSLAHGVPGDEGLGPGGLSAALRSWPAVRQLLSQVRRNAPLCLPILLTSPGSLLVRLAARAFPGFPVCAICELPFTTLEDICRASTKSVDQVHFSYAGVNHLGWFYQVSCDNQDLVDAYCQQQKDSCFYPLIRERCAVPLKYFRLHLDAMRPAAQVSQNGRGSSRARQLAAIHTDSMGAFGCGDTKEIQIALGKRLSPWYTEAIGPLLLQFSEGEDSAVHRKRPFFISSTDANETISEKACYLEGRAFRALPTADPPVWLRELNDGYIEYERQAALSVEEPNLKKITAALNAHPWITREHQAAAIAEALWQAHEVFENERETATCPI